MFQGSGNPHLPNLSLLGGVSDHPGSGLPSWLYIRIILGAFKNIRPDSPPPKTKQKKILSLLVWGGALHHVGKHWSRTRVNDGNMLKLIYCDKLCMFTEISRTATYKKLYKDICSKKWKTDDQMADFSPNLSTVSPT